MQILNVRGNVLRVSTGDDVCSDKKNTNMCRGINEIFAVLGMMQSRLVVTHVSEQAVFLDCLTFKWDG
jgi:hypothetical protein